MVFDGLAGAQLEVALEDMQDLDAVQDFVCLIMPLLAADCQGPLFFIDRWE